MNTTSLDDLLSVTQENFSKENFRTMPPSNFEIFNIVADITNIIFNYIITCIMGVIGVVTNILNILVLSQHGMKDSTNIVLLALSVSDLTFSCCETFWRLVRVVLRIEYLLAYSPSILYNYLLAYISVSAMNISVWLVAVISIERMVAVCFPFHAARIVTTKRIKLVIVFVYCFIFSLYMPIMAMFYFEWRFDSRFNVTGIMVFIRPAYFENITFFKILETYVLPASVLIAPMITILLCTFTTIVRLKTATQNIGELSTSRSKRVKEMRSIKISLVICLCMAFSILIPNACLDAYISIKGDQLPLYVNIFIRSFTQFAVQFNASMNFFLYVAMSSKFSKTYLKLFRCKKN